jgi:nucleobase:cation symporter-1, NCS1 family
MEQKGKIQLTNWEIVSVNPNDKKWNWTDLFCFWGVSIQSIISFSLIASLYLVYELNFFVVFTGCLIGSFFVYFFANLIGKPSQKHGIPFPVLLRISMGISGAKYISLLRGMVGVFMFGVQTYFISKSFSYLIRIALHSIDNTIQDHSIFFIFILELNIVDWIAFLLAIFIQFFLYTKGHLFNKFLINLSAIIVYFGMIIFLIIIVLNNNNDLINSFKDLIILDNIFLQDNIIQIVTVAGTIFAYFSMVVVNFGDFSRYVKNENELKKGNLSLLLNLIIFSLFSILIVIGADIILNKNMVKMEQIFTNPMDIIGKFNNTVLTFIVLFLILFASASTNLIANYIPAQNSFINLLPSRLSLKTSGLLIILFAFFVGIFWAPLLSKIGILSFVDTISAFFGPIFGIVVIDYYIISKRTIVNKDIFSSLPNGTYYYSSGWHIKAIYSLLIGFIFSATTIWNADFNYLQSFSWIIGAIASSITYYLMANR